MRRLFHAYERAEQKAVVDHGTYSYAGSAQGVFLRDVVIRNWGDKSVVHDDDMSWEDELGTVYKFRELFMRGVNRSLEQTREVPMDVERYLVDASGKLPEGVR
jgi:hypothetical protein